MKVKKSKNSNLWFASSELNQILAIQLFRKFCPVNLFLIPFRAIWNFSYLLKPTLNGFFCQGGRSMISLNLDSHTLLALLLCPPFIFGVGVKKKLIFRPQWFVSRDFELSKSCSNLTLLAPNKGGLEVSKKMQYVSVAQCYSMSNLK